MTLATGLPGPSALEAALVATWPADDTVAHGPFTLRRSPGGGRRVTAATLTGTAFGEADLVHAETQMTAWGQRCLFRITPDQPALDHALMARGYVACDATAILTAPASALSHIETPRLTTFDIWPPLAIMAEIWEDGGIGGDRIAVMARTEPPHTSLFARLQDRPAGAGFVAGHGGIAMIHALEVKSQFRGQGVGKRMMGHAARWALRHDCAHLAVAVTRDNASARVFYDALGFVEAGRYHYRTASGAPDA